MKWQCHYQQFFSLEKMNSDQKDAPVRMKETQEVWEIFKKGWYEIYISDIVVDEINNTTLQL